MTEFELEDIARISIHASARRATGDGAHIKIFLSTPPRGGRHSMGCFAARAAIFYPRPSARRATSAASPGRPCCPFLSTPSARRATAGGFSAPAPTSYFYPRPPRGGRRTPCPRLRHSPIFYPRPPRGGRPAVASISAFAFSILSTPSARRATRDGLPHRRRCPILSTPSARRATGAAKAQDHCGGDFIHALREEGDVPRTQRFFAVPILSTPSARRATGVSVGYRIDTIILSTPSARRATPEPDPDHGCQQFLSTPSARRATAESAERETAGEFFIHALREEGDDNNTVDLPIDFGILSTPSARRATYEAKRQQRPRMISIHALREEGDRSAVVTSVQSTDFLSTPSARRATLDKELDFAIYRTFLSTPSARRATQ